MSILPLYTSNKRSSIIKNRFLTFKTIPYMHTVTNLSDDELVVRIQNGQTNAFTILVYRYEEKVLNLLTSLTKNRTHAEDLKQDTFLKAFNAIVNNTYKLLEKFSQWIFRIARNEFIDYCRKMKKCPITSAKEELSELAHNCISIGYDPVEKIAGIANKLPSDTKEVFTLYYLKGLKLREIADTTGIPINSCKRKTVRGRKAFIAIYLAEK